MKHSSNQLIVIILLVSLLITVCIIYLYVNRGDEKIAEISLRSLLVPVFVAFGLLLIEYFKPINVTERDFVVAITDNPFTMTRLISGPESSSTYLTDATMTINVIDAKLKKNLKADYEINRTELLELYIYRLINDRFHKGWKTEYERSIPFFETRMIVKSPVVDVTSEVYDLSRLKKMYEEDHFIQVADDTIVQEDLDLYLPKGTNLTVSGNSTSRSMIFDTGRILLTIKIKRETIATLPHTAGKTAATIRKKLNLPLEESYRLDFYGYSVESEITPRRFFRGNPLTFEHLEWATELMNHIEESYSWEKLYEAIEIEE